MEDLAYNRFDLKPAEYNAAEYLHDPNATVPGSHYLIPPGFALCGIMLRFAESPDRAYDFSVIDPDGQEVVSFRTHTGWVFAGRLFDPRPALSAVHRFRLILPDGCPDMEVVSLYHPAPPSPNNDKWMPLSPDNPGLPL